jgi:hypothetical protein
MADLKFISTQTVEQFKKAQGVDSIKVRKNPHTSKLFFTYGAETGAVSTKGIPTHPMISKVEGDGTCFFLLHEEGTGGAPVLAEF